jgi:all-trans-retinol 13,14-reductase
MTGNGKPFVVIGGGISGMTAALILSKFGFQVTIVEKKSRLGAMLRGFSRNGINFDAGLHYVGGLHPEGALTRYFKYLGLCNLPWVDYNREGFDRIRFIEEDREILLPVGKEAMIAGLSADFPDDSDFISSFYNEIEESFHSSTFLTFRFDEGFSAVTESHRESLAERLNVGTKNPILRAVLSIHSLLYGVSPEETPLMQHARIAGSYLDGVKALAGGGRVLADAYEKRLNESGVTCLTGAAATSVSIDTTGLVNGVTLVDRHIRAYGVLFTAHPHILPKLLPKGAVKPAFSRRLTALEETCSAHTLFCRSDETIPILRGSNLFICKTSDINSAFRQDATPDDGPFYISCGMSNSPESQPAGVGLMFFAPGNIAEYARWENSRTGRRPESYYKFKAKRLDKMRSALLSCCPEIRKVRVVEGGTPLTNRDYLASPGGGLYGTKHSLNQFSPLPITRIPNLWMAGQSVIAPGVLGTVVSAFVACGFILGLKNLQKELCR